MKASFERFNLRNLGTHQQMAIQICMQTTQIKRHSIPYLSIPLRSSLLPFILCPSFELWPPQRNNSRRKSLLKHFLSQLITVEALRRQEIIIKNDKSVTGGRKEKRNTKKKKEKKSSFFFQSASQVTSCARPLGRGQELIGIAGPTAPPVVHAQWSVYYIFILRGCYYGEAYHRWMAVGCVWKSALFVTVCILSIIFLMTSLTFVQEGNCYLYCWLFEFLARSREVSKQKRKSSAGG